MLSHYFALDSHAGGGLQEQLRKAMLDAIHAGVIPPEEALPSCRKLSTQLGVSRNTVALVYERLVDDGYLVSRPRSGYYLHEAYCTEGHDIEPDVAFPNQVMDAPNWGERLKSRPSYLQNVLRPSQWMTFDYPFIYGQLDQRLFPMDAWRGASKRLMGAQQARCWLHDRYDQDDPMLIEQLRSRVLPKRGIHAQQDEILITMGAQNALFLVAQLLLNRQTRVAVENPGYREAINVLLHQGVQISYQDVDHEGICLDADSARCDYLYVTPSHQVPTGVTMSAERRQQLIQQVSRCDQIVLEDDYDAEINFNYQAQPALKSTAIGSRVIYMSSLSKPLSPGLRLGYLVADAALVEELRALRRLMYRHPPSGLQQQLAQFLAQGHYDRYLRTFNAEMRARWEVLENAVCSEMPTCQRISEAYASAFWLALPEQYDSQRLAWQAAQQGVLIEPGFQHFFSQIPPRHYIRLGYGVIGVEAIPEGIQRLASML